MAPIGRRLTVAAIAVGLRGIALRRWVWTPAWRRLELEGEHPGHSCEEGPEPGPGSGDPGPQDPRRSQDAARRRFRSGSRHWLVFGWILLATSTAAVLVGQAATVSGSSLLHAASGGVISGVLHTTFGRLWTWRAVATLLLAVPLLGLIRRRRLFGVPPDVWIAAAGFLAVAVAGATGLDGHARTAPRPALDVAAITVHLLAVAVWVGGLAVLVLVALPAWRALHPAGRSRALRHLLPRFSRVAVVSVSVLISTGTVVALGELHRPSDLWSNDHGGGPGLPGRSGGHSALGPPRPPALRGHRAPASLPVDQPARGVRGRQPAADRSQPGAGAGSRRHRQRQRHHR
ncbi:MAG: hypothetical protein ACYDAD_15280 [Acidimicrobiales bacterium]